MKKLIIQSVLLSLIAISCLDTSKKELLQSQMPSEIDEESLYRPNYHFTPKVGWMNDPNGMFYYNGYYHLFFQHYPDGNKWGPMHWGHAITTDLVHWKEMPIALYPDEKGYIFSGSTVIDFENKSGLGKDGQTPIVAFFTYHNPKLEKTESTELQTQGMAYSVDEGITWTKFENNPVVNNPGIRDFRDPKVSWDEASDQFVMTLAAGQKIMFYGSKNLKEWSFLSDFGDGVGNHGGVWECPDLFPIKVEGTEDTKYVLLVSINPGGPNGGSATQYFIGDFVGGKFIIDAKLAGKLPSDHNYWVDFGKDNYAGVTWSNASLKDGAKLFIGWMFNWQYANEVPTQKWRSASTIPRELRLIDLGDDYRLTFQPTKNIKEFYAAKLKKEVLKVDEKAVKVFDSKNIPLTSTKLSFTLKEAKNSSFITELRNEVGDTLKFGFDHLNQTFFIDRSLAGKTEFSNEFSSKKSIAPRISNNEDLKVTALLDKTSLELFYDDGTTVMTEIFFLNQPFSELWMKSKKGQINLNSIEVHELKIN